MTSLNGLFGEKAMAEKSEVRGFKSIAGIWLFLGSLSSMMAIGGIGFLSRADTALQVVECAVSGFVGLMMLSYVTIMCAKEVSRPKDR